MAAASHCWTPTWHGSPGALSSSPLYHIIWSLCRFEYGARVNHFLSENRMILHWSLFLRLLMSFLARSRQHSLAPSEILWHLVLAYDADPRSTLTSLCMVLSETPGSRASPHMVCLGFCARLSRTSTTSSGVLTRFAPLLDGPALVHPAYCRVAGASLVLNVR